MKLTKTQQLILSCKENNLQYATRNNKPKLRELYEHTLALYKKELVRKHAAARTYNNPFARFEQQLEAEQ